MKKSITYSLLLALAIIGCTKENLSAKLMMNDTIPSQRQAAKVKIEKSYEVSIIEIAKDIHKKWGSDSKHRKVIVVDFSKQMEEKRLFIVDIDSNKIVKSTKVCHGVGSGACSIPNKFSNKNNSKMSTLGVMRTAETYYGSWGYSMRVDGLQRSNSNVRKRAIIFHNSDVQKTPWSWGCFSIPGTDIKSVIDLTKGGCLIYAFTSKN
jgi:hypothetical protein